MSWWKEAKKSTQGAIQGGTEGLVKGVGSIFDPETYEGWSTRGAIDSIMPGDNGALSNQVMGPEGSPPPPDYFSKPLPYEIPEYSAQRIGADPRVTFNPYEMSKQDMSPHLNLQKSQADNDFYNSYARGSSGLSGSNAERMSGSALAGRSDNLGDLYGGHSRKQMGSDLGIDLYNAKQANMADRFNTRNIYDEAQFEHGSKVKGYEERMKDLAARRTATAMWNNPNSSGGNGLFDWFLE